ncbi:holo-ACP synthase [Inmirania thermothiophila]|uniref:Holo-[acyl-carrier-protein] synthase n=1 Tax=Inmirania thermothiophila TaxID=1750597 RepID=A0A3N1XZV7_9GAMM|nr:holo-ACP synthase [Inmirania thermothiophila]ROR32135.1 holo-[acyl-carrier protein] synthase [Inmirania thermothiophila]
MIVGLGTDVVRVARLARLHARWGVRLERRLLAPEERAELARSARPAHFLARRFAAKEAAVKALGTGFRDGIRKADVVVGHDPRGAPRLELRGAAARRARALGVARVHLSLSDEEDVALAVVILEAQPPAS